MNKVNYIIIKDKQIPIMIKNYRKSNSIKMYFVGTTLKISKPMRLSNNKLMKIIEQNKDNIYNDYIKILSVENVSIKHWYTGEKILYGGEKYSILINNTNDYKLNISIEQEQKQIVINVPGCLNDNDRKLSIDKSVKKLFKNDTRVLISERLEYWSRITNIEYTLFKITDATTRFGSCKPMTKELCFNLRLIMLPQDKVDAIVVHELCHIMHKGHNKEFYDLVQQYIPNYKEIDKWLKVNSKLINI